jgi:hypothetical protein
VRLKIEFDPEVFQEKMQRHFLSVKKKIKFNEFIEEVIKTEEI